MLKRIPVLDVIRIRGIRDDQRIIIKHIPDANSVKTWPHVIDFSFNLKEGDSVNQITSSLNRYGHLTLVAGNRASIEDAFEKYVTIIKIQSLQSEI